LTKPNPAEAANDLNQILCDAGIDEKFITMSLNMLDPLEHRLTLASAGHLPVIVRRSTGYIEEVGEEIAGFPLGIMPGVEYAQTEIKLTRGDVVVIFSDGVTDSRNVREELYDTKDNRRLIRRIQESSGSPSEVGRSILQAIREFSVDHAQADDITLICFGPVVGSESTLRTSTV
jgi:serine phosphatase RsbU (regulator of sigma subunit)